MCRWPGDFLFSTHHLNELQIALNLLRHLLSERLDFEPSQLFRLEADLIHAIGKINNNVHATLLIRKYILEESYADIATTLDYSTKQLRRINAVCLRNLSDIVLLAICKTVLHDRLRQFLQYGKITVFQVTQSSFSKRQPLLSFICLDDIRQSSAMCF